MWPEATLATARIGREEDAVSDFDTQLREWYEAEVAGKAFFSAMADAARDDAEAEKWSLLGRLEATMAERLRKACAVASVALPEQPSDSGYMDAARQMGGRPWLSNMEALKGQLQEAVIRIRSLAEQAPAAHADIAGEFLEHEEALAAFVSAEVEGEDGSPAIQSLLRKWS